MLSYSSFSQIPQGYYDDAQGLGGETLQQALHTIIDDHYQLSYAELWDAFETTDMRTENYIWDIYSDVPGSNPPYLYTIFSDQCGNYGSEGDCYNREHSFPKSWFGGKNYPMYTDLNMIYPTDGYVNGRRNNYPYGEVGTVSWLSQNGSKLGQCDFPGYSGTVFEPIDEYKGDLARTYFYVSTRYLNEDAGWPGSGMVNGSQPEAWALELLLAWHQNDPVSQKEINRNNAVYEIQQNRNPFIDHPEWIEAIWVMTGTKEQHILEEIKLSPVPVKENLNIETGSGYSSGLDFQIKDITGSSILSGTINDRTLIDVSSLNNGLYILILHDSSKNRSKVFKFIKSAA